MYGATTRQNNNGPSYWLQGSIHRAGQQQYKTTINTPSPLMAEDQSLSQCLTREQRVNNDAPASSRHCGLDPQSRGEGSGNNTNQHRPVILASRQYPQGGATTIQNNHQYPLSLDERGPKPVPVPDTGAEGENDAPASSRHCGLDPQSRGEGSGNNTNQHRPVILALRQYPQGRWATPRIVPTPTPHRHSRLRGNPQGGDVGILHSNPIIAIPLKFAKFYNDEKAPFSHSYKSSHCNNQHPHHHMTHKPSKATSISLP